MANNEAHGQAVDLVGWGARLTSQANTLRGEIEEKRATLAHVEEQLNLINRLIELGGGTGAITSPATAHPAAPNASQPEKGAVGVNSTQLALEDAVAAILADDGKPMHVSKIREALIDCGVPIPGRGDDANIIVKISVQQRFSRTARGTYALTEWGLPQMKSTRRRRAVKTGADR